MFDTKSQKSNSGHIIEMTDKRTIQEQDNKPGLLAVHDRQAINPNVRCGYVTGIGWCWMCEGEIIEVIQEEGEDGSL